MTLRNRLFLTIALCGLLPLVLVTWIYDAQSRDSLRESAVLRLQGETNSRLARLEQLIEQNHERLALVASRTQLRLSLARHLDSPAPAELARVRRILSDALRSIDEFERMVVLHPETQELLVATDDGGTVPEVARRPLGERGAFLRVDGRLLLFLRAPLVLGERQVGWLVIQCLSGAVVELTEDRAWLGEGGAVTLVQRQPDGRIIEIAGSQPVARQLAVEAASGRPARLVEVDGLIALARSVPRLDCGLVVTVSSDEAFAGLYRLERIALGLVGGALLLVLLASRWLGHSLTRRLRELAERSRLAASGEGRFEALHDERPDEIGQLARALARMGEDLRLSTVSRAYLEALQRALSEGVVTVRRDGRIVSSNPAAAALFGLPQEQMVGQHLSALVPALAAPEGGDVLDRYAALGGDARGVETEGLRGRASFPLYLALRELPVGDVDEEPLRVAAMRDVTAERERLRELEESRLAAERASQAKSRFLANMSHEIRTPLNGVIGMSGVLVEMDLEPDQLRVAQTIDSSGRLLLEVLNEILDFSKIEAGELLLETSSFPVESLVEDLLELHSSNAHARHLELIGLVSPDVPLYLVGDGARIRQVLNNLVSNALKFTEGGEVIVRIDRVRGTDERITCRFSVRDTGQGIPQDAVERLFHPFTQADESTSRTHGGTGLGLAICKQLVELMGGQIGIDSRVGEGTTVWFELELVIDRDMSEGRVHDLRGMSVLVVDDNETNRGVLTHYLTAWQAIPTPCASGNEALAVLRAGARAGRPFRLVLLDMQMPGMDGLEVAAAIAADPALDDPVVILLTSLVGVDPARSEGLIAAQLTKPVRARQLIQLIAELLGERDDAAVRPRPPTEETPVWPTGTRVLIAEDNPINQQVMLAHMKRLGLRADCVADGVEALDALDRRVYSLVLMDCHMPRLDGYSATRELRTRAECANRDVPVVAVTASTVSGEREKVRAAGMDDYLAKPFTAETLAAVVGRLLMPDRTPRTVGRLRETDAGQEVVLDSRPLSKLRQLGEASGQPDLLRRLIRGFLEQAPTRVAEIRAAAEAGDPAGLESAAHSLKGSAATLGASRLSALCQQAEQSAEDGAPEALARIDEVLRETLEALALVEPDAATPPD